MFRTPQVVLFSEDLERAVTFYTSLGFNETFRVPTEGDPIHVDLALDDYYSMRREHRPWFHHTSGSAAC